MSRWIKAVLAFGAASLVFGAVQLEIASGSDLKAGPVNFRDRAETAQIAADTVNRSSKGDRLGQVRPGAAGPTMVFSVVGLPNTTVATFTANPLASATTATIKARAIMHTAACEPPVSAMTELAHKIENGRCLT